MANINNKDERPSYTQWSRIPSMENSRIFLECVDAQFDRDKKLPPKKAARGY